MSEDTNRLGKLIERTDGVDFPFYNGVPVLLPAWKWAVIILACAVGMLVLSLVGSHDQRWELLPRVLFTGIPLAAFITLARPYWQAIFRPLMARDIGLMVAFWLLNLAISALVALLISGGNFSHFSANTATDNLADGGALNIVAFYVGTFIQLFGEELFTILPFLAILSWLYTNASLSRHTSVVLAWVITATWFGAAHLPTYGWNVAQAILVIGAARIILTLAFIRTKNILVSFGAHLLNDWSTFTFVLIAAAR